MRMLSIGLGTLLWMFVVTAIIRPLARAYCVSQRHLRRAAERDGLWPKDEPVPRRAGVEAPVHGQIHKVVEVRQIPLVLHRLARKRWQRGFGCWHGARNAWLVEFAGERPALTIPYAEGDSEYLGLEVGELEKRCTEVRWVEVRSVMIWVYFAVFLLIDLLITAKGLLVLNEWTP